jgi:hypothetical protein
MAAAELYRRQVALIIKAIPLIATETSFALKGGTAINLVVRDIAGDWRILQDWTRIAVRRCWDGWAKFSKCRIDTPARDTMVVPKLKGFPLHVRSISQPR